MKDYTETLIETFGFTPRDAKEFQEGYLDVLDINGYNRPGLNCKPTGKDITLFGGIFYQIEHGGHRLITPDGRPVRALMVSSEAGTEKSESGEDCWRVNLVYPQFGMGNIIVALRGCDTSEWTVLFGVSDKNDRLMGAIETMCGWD